MLHLTAKKKNKNREKEGKSGKIGKKREKSGKLFHVAPSDRAGYATVHYI